MDHSNDSAGKPLPLEEKAERLLSRGSCQKAAELFHEASRKHPAQRGRLLHRAAVAYWKAGVYDLAAENFTAAAREYSSSGDRQGEARNILGLGASYHGLNRYSEAYRVMHDALELAEGVRDQKTVSDATTWLGIICKEQGDYSLALEHHKKALELSGTSGSESDLASSHNSIGLTYYHMGNYDKAVEHFQQALRLQRSIEGSWGLPDTLNSLGMAMRKMGRLKEALEFYEEALQSRKKMGGKARTANILNNLANLHTDMGNLEQALKFHSEALEIRRDISSRSGVASSLLNLGELWKELGKLHKAAAALEEALSCQQNNRPDELMLDTLRQLSCVRNLMGDLDEAYSKSQQALDVSMELYRDQMEKRLEESREILETEHRIRESKLLLSKNRKLKELSDMLSSQKGQLQLILDFIPAIVLFIDNDGTLLRLNKYAARLCGCEPRELVGSTGEDHFGNLGSPLSSSTGDPEELPEPVLNCEESVEIGSVERVYLCQRVPYREAGGDVVGLVVMAMDITDEKRAQEKKHQIQELRSRAKRMESLGYLAGSIAHDFNNLLLGITGNVEMVMGLTSDARSRNCLEKASESARRATALCDQLLAFSGAGGFETRRIDLSRELSFLLKSLSFDPEVPFQIFCDLSDHLPEIEMSTEQLRLILHNLLSILSEASPASEKFTIATGMLTAGEDYISNALQGFEATAAEYVFLEIGSGVLELTCDEFQVMFDPISSADVLKTDLRLPAVHGLIKSLGGFMTWQNNEGSGCAVRIHFRPVASAECRDGSVVVPAGNPSSAGESILIVDDEATVRDTAREMLVSMGFSVMTCSSGFDAISLLEERRDEVGCVLLDLTMPDMSGHEVIREISRLYPEMKVVLTSGYSQRMLDESVRNPCYRGFLKKPYSLKELRRMIDDVMG